VAVCIILTITIGIVTSKRKSASDELTRRIETAHETKDPEQVIRAMREYLDSNPPEKLALTANEELRKATLEIDDRDYQTAIATDRGEQTDLNQLESTLRGYVEKHADGAHRLEVLERLEQIPARRDDHAFARARTNAAAAGEDLGLREAAWQVYLESFPEGQHAVQARAEIARIPDQIDERRYRSLVAEIEPLVTADRVTEALLRLESGVQGVQSPQRRALIEERVAALEARLEQGDAAVCLEMPATSADERQRAAESCRLYLLCYPRGASRPAIEERLRDLAQIEHTKLLTTLRAKLAEIGDDPLAILAALDEYRRQPAAIEVDIRKDVAVNHLELLDRAVRASLQDMLVITLRDGTTLIGKVTEASPGWVQVKPRAAAADGDAPPSRLVRTSEIDAANPTLPENMKDLRERMRPLLAADPLELGPIIAAVRSLAPPAGDELYRPERLAFQVCVAGLDPSDTAVRDELTTAGYVPHNGVFRAVVSTATSKPTSKPASDSSIAADSPHKAALDYFRVYCGERIPTDVLRARLADSFNYAFLGTQLTIPIEWDLTDPQCQPAIVSNPGDPFQATLVYTFPARSRRTSDNTLPTSILAELSRELARLNQATRIQITYEIKIKIERLTGVGIETRPRDDDLIVNRVFPGSSAARAGVELGDRIALVNGRPLPDIAADDALALAIANSPPGGIEFTFIRAGRRFRLTLERGDYSVDKCRMRSEIETRGPLSKESENTISEWIDVPAPS
jgi:hypothetical protein